MAISTLPSSSLLILLFCTALSLSVIFLPVQVTIRNLYQDDSWKSEPIAVNTVASKDVSFWQKDTQNSSVNCSALESLRLFTIQGCRVTQQRFIPFGVDNEKKHAAGWSSLISRFLRNTICPPPEKQPIPIMEPYKDRPRQILAYVTDWNVYRLGNYTGFPSCTLAASAAGGFPDSQLIVTPYELGALILPDIKDAVPFQKRSGAAMVWRGVLDSDTTGMRTKLVHLAESQNISWLDVKNTSDGNRLENKVHPQILCNKFKYHIDVPGHAGTTWTALQWKMNCGALVFRMESPIGSKDWWHRYLKPYRHYIPVEATKESLYKWYQWAESHPDKAEAIAKAGQSLARWSAKDANKGEQMLRAFFQSCEPDLKEYNEFREYCINDLHLDSVSLQSESRSEGAKKENI